MIARRLGKIAERTATIADDAVVDLLRRTRHFFIIAASVAGATLFLDLPARALAVGRVLGTIALILQIAIWGNGLISFWFKSYAEQKADSDISSRTTIAAFSFVARATLWVMLALVALNRLGYDVTALITGLGVGGIAIALAVQNILGDLFGALAIVVDKPFVVGDSISVDTVSGTVEHIGLKTTRLRSVSGEQVIFSNADLLKSRIRNHNRMQERRVLFTLGVTDDHTGSGRGAVTRSVRPLALQRVWRNGAQLRDGVLRDDARLPDVHEHQSGGEPDATPAVRGGRDPVRAPVARDRRARERPRSARRRVASASLGAHQRSESSGTSERAMT
jgi:hypothetical protein